MCCSKWTCWKSRLFSFKSHVRLRKNEFELKCDRDSLSGNHWQMSATVNDEGRYTTHSRTSYFINTVTQFITAIFKSPILNTANLNEITIIRISPHLQVSKWRLRKHSTLHRQTYKLSIIVRGKRKNVRNFFSKNLTMFVDPRFVTPISFVSSVEFRTELECTLGGALT